MKTFETRTLIQAPRDVIWNLLTDAEHYPDWNPTVTRIDGRIGVGNSITVHATVSPGRAFPVKVVVLEPATTMVWRGGMPMGLFTGLRTFTLSADAGDGVDFSMQEVFSGLLSPLISRSIPDLQPSFDEFAAALKTRAEAGQPGLVD